MATMRQELMTEPKKIIFRDVPIPEIGPDQVLVKIKKIGICGSDIHVYHGTHPYTSYPVTQGHEVSGQIVKVGDQAIQNARKGSTIILVAVFGKRANVDLAKLNDSELDLNTSMMYRHEDFVDAIKFVEEGKIQLKPLQSAHFSFEDFPKAYDFIDNNRETTMKVIIDVDPEEKD